MPNEDREQLRERDHEPVRDSQPVSFVPTTPQTTYSQPATTHTYREAPMEMERPHSSQQVYPVDRPHSSQQVYPEHQQQQQSGVNYYGRQEESSGRPLSHMDSVGGTHYVHDGAVSRTVAEKSAYV